MSTLSEMVDELKRLVDADVQHDQKLHEGLNHCESCERSVIVEHIRNYLRFEADTQPQDHLGGKSRAELELPKVEQYWEGSKAAATERAKKR